MRYLLHSPFPIVGRKRMRSSPKVQVPLNDIEDEFLPEKGEKVEEEEEEDKEEDSPFV